MFGTEETLNTNTTKSNRKEADGFLNIEAVLLADGSELPFYIKYPVSLFEKDNKGLTKSMIERALSSQEGYLEVKLRGKVRANVQTEVDTSSFADLQF